MAKKQFEYDILLDVTNLTDDSKHLMESVNTALDNMDSEIWASLTIKVGTISSPKELGVKAINYLIDKFKEKEMDVIIKKR